MHVRGNPDGQGSAKEWVVEDNEIGIIDCAHEDDKYRAGMLIRGMDHPVIRRNKIETHHARGIILNKGKGSGQGGGFFRSRNL